MTHRFPDLGTGRFFVSAGICGIAELVHVKRARNFRGQPRRHVLIIFGVPSRNVRPREPHFGAERADMRDFLLRHLVGNHEDRAIAFGAADQRESQPRVAGRRFHNGPAGL